MVKKLHHTLSKIPYYRTKNVPWHILAPAAVACDICIVRHSAHPRGAFLCNRNEVSYYTKNNLCTQIPCRGYFWLRIFSITYLYHFQCTVLFLF